MSGQTRTGDNPGNDDAPSSRESYTTPWISAADIPLSACPTQHISDKRRVAVEERARKIATTWTGSDKNHITGKLGEYALAQFLGLPERLDVEVYSDGGDGGADLSLCGTRVDAKTVGQEYADNPELWVGVRENLDADYYVLVSRVGRSDFRMIGYAPRSLVANAPIREHHGTRCFVVPREYLFPFACLSDMR